MAQYLLQHRVEDIPLCLSPDEALYLKKRISSIEMEETRLKFQISQLKCQLKTKRQDLAVMFNILAPIRRLPFELLSNIFYECCFPRTTGPFTYSKGLKPQLILSQICSTWRVVAFGTPRLWCEFEVLLRRRGGVSLYDTMMVDSWLGRSGSLPLDVLIAQRHPNSFARPEIILNRLIPFCNRLQSLTLSLSFRCLLSFLDNEPTFPVLEKLELILQNEPDVTPSRLESPRISTFLNARQLCAVKLNLPGSTHDDRNSNLTRTVFMFPLPLDQLSLIHLELRPNDHYSLSDARSFLDVVRNCQSTVVECRLVRCPASLRDILAKLSTPIVFPNLKALHLQQWDEDSEARFIQLVTVPSLATLCIDHSEYGGDDPSEIFCKHLVDMGGRSSISLLTLELVRVRLMCTEDILSVLAVLPTLKYLKLCDCNLNTRLFARGLELLDSEGQCLMVPRLESLYLIDFELIPKGCEDSIVDMVESRVVAVVNSNKRACFRALTLGYIHHRLSEAMINRLKELLSFEMKD